MSCSFSNDIQARDAFYQELLNHQIMKEIDEPVSMSSVIFDTHELAKRISLTGCYIRNRFIHKVGYIAKGLIDGKYPVMIRLSRLNITSSLKIVGFGIRTWKDGNTYDGLLLNILTDEQSDLSSPMSNYIPQEIPTLTGKFLAGIMTGSFNLTGFDSTHNDLSGILPQTTPFKQIFIHSLYDGNITNLINSNTESDWEFSSSNGDIIAKLHLEPFNDNPSVGYQIIFHHNLKPLVGLRLWWQTQCRRNTLGKLVYMLFYGFSFLFH